MAGPTDPRKHEHNRPGIQDPSPSLQISPSLSPSLLAASVALFFFALSGRAAAGAAAAALAVLRHIFIIVFYDVCMCVL